MTSHSEANQPGILKASASNAGGRMDTGRMSVTFLDGQNRHYSERTSPALNPLEVQRLIAARIIERAWMSCRDKKMFNLLKHATCAAEKSLSYEILRKISPKEAQLIQDKGIPVKVRFRFGGEEFPPLLFFKIFSDTSTMSLKYMSGKKAIKPATQAAQEACELMGKRKFLQIMVQDTMCHSKYKITDEVDITTLKDYMQYLSHIDELPCNMGGKDNFWRKLTLDVIPRQTIFYDVMDFFIHKNMSERLESEIPLLIQSPTNPEIELHHMEIVSRMSTPQIPHYQTPKMIANAKNQTSGRRSKQAQNRVNKMKKVYGMEKAAVDGAGLSDGEMDEEALKLFQWTKELSFEELDRFATPHLPPIST